MAASMLKARQRRQEIRSFYKERYALRGAPPEEARTELMQRFGLENKDWYNIKTDLKDVLEVTLATGGGKNGQMVTEPDSAPPPVEIPSNLPPKAKAAMDQVLAVNNQQENLLLELRAERDSLRQENIRLSVKCRTLNKVVSEVLGAL